MMKYLRRTTSALNDLVLADAGSTHLNTNKIKPITARNSTHCRVATSHRFFCISATTLPLPRLSPYLPPGVGRCSAIALCLGGCLCSLNDHLQVLSPAIRLFSRHQRTHALQGGIATTPSPLSSSSLNFVCLRILHWPLLYPEPPFTTALGFATALEFLLRVGVLCCVVVGGDSQTPYSAALGLAAALGLTFFGVRASWIVVQ
jgi:hypothetical protein